MKDKAISSIARLLAGALFLISPNGLSAKVPARTIALDASAETTPRDRMAQMSIGSDYPGTLLRADSLAQLQVVKNELHFRYIRFHNIFADQLGTYREEGGQPIYDWRRIDELYDHLLGVGLKPFVELGFTPDAMKTSNQTIFYWKGNTSHPEPAKWTRLVDAFVRHVIARYGTKEVRSWYFEFWNEPNLAGFWEGADQQAYFDTYARTARAIKMIDPALRVGGPATAGAAWVPEFLTYARQHDVPVDFITTHTYGVEGGFLDEKGQGDNKLSRNPDAIVADVRHVREQIEASGYKGLPLFFTEWSTSYNPRDPIHDDYLGAAYILSKLRRTEGIAQGMSYWTFSDLFEEPGPQTQPFEGGFGLMSPQGIRKPAWFAFKYLAELGNCEIPTGDHQSIATVKGRQIQFLAWRDVSPDQTVSNRPFFRKVRVPSPAAPIHLTVANLRGGAYRVLIWRTGFRQNDAYTAWMEMGSPPVLTGAQIARLQALTADEPVSRTVRVGAHGQATLDLPMRDNDVVMVTLAPIPD